MLLNILCLDVILTRHKMVTILQFVKLRGYMKLKEEYDSLKFQLSDASLQLLPEYRQRIQVCIATINSAAFAILSQHL